MSALIGLAFLALVIVLLVALIRKPDVMTIGFGVMAVLLYLLFIASRDGLVGVGADASADSDKAVSLAQLIKDAGVVEAPDDSVLADIHPVFNPGPCAEQRTEEPPMPSPNAQTLALMSKSNKESLNQIYGQRYAGTVDDALLAHKKRIGDRDRRATVIQVRARRNNVMEPYYRQELSEHNSVRWWEPDDALTTVVGKRQLDTLEMGRSAIWNADNDGYYPQW